MLLKQQQLPERIKQQRRQYIVVDAVLLSEDVLLAIFQFTEFPILMRIQRVCRHWKTMVQQRALVGLLGHKPFETREELIQRIREYCSVDKVKYSHAIARIYGWPIGRWNVSRITNFHGAFVNCRHFNEDIGNWDMSNAITLYGMFYFAQSFNQNLSKWNTSKVIDMTGVFMEATRFNQDLSTWNTSNVATMSHMFYKAESFNQDISSWDVSQAVDMESMFEKAARFNQILSKWNVENVQDMDRMFYGATSFRQNNNISEWDVSNVIYHRKTGLDPSVFADDEDEEIISALDA